MVPLGLEEDQNEPVLNLSVSVPAWGVQKSLKITLTSGSFRRVHQRLERFANEASERDGAVTLNAPSPEECADLEKACSKEFATLTRRYDAARELAKSRRMNNAAEASTIVQDAAAHMQHLRGGKADEDEPMAAWAEDLNERPSANALDKPRDKAEDLRTQLKDAEAYLAQ